MIAPVFTTTTAEDDPVERRPASDVDVTKPNVARIYDYMLGGKDNFGADRQAAERLLAVAPESAEAARANRRFLVRAVRFLAGAGIRQFLDIGTGLPTRDNVHQVAQRIDPGCRVVYVDNDPVVCAHGRALLGGTETAAFVEGDIHDPGAILGHPDTKALIDFSRPVAILLAAVLHFIPDADDPGGLVARLRAAMAPGSYLVLSQGAAQARPDAVEKARSIYRGATAPMVPRGHADILAFFGDLRLVDPGLVYVVQWRPDGGEPSGPPEDSFILGGLGRKD